jgi:tetratricopeptide (TPR) repeat protein
VNLALALDGVGRTEEALELLRSHRGAEAANMRGNLLVHLNRHQEAVEAYRQAVKEDPRNRTYRINFASASLEADQIHQAEEALAVLEEENPASEVRNLLGNIARLKGEYLRAETAYESALDLDETNYAALINLADLQAHRGKFAEARAALDRLPRDRYTPRALRLEERLKKELEEQLSCDSCDRNWSVPRNLPDQGPLRLRGEVPDEAPAGRCEDCGFLLCVGCAKPYLSDGRFICPECGGKLKLSDNSLRYLLKKITGLDEESQGTNI